jgi:DNA-binding CsgD family transcriptional regulator
MTIPSKRHISNRLRNPLKLPLTARQLEIISFLTQGKTFWEIGTILGISHKTVDLHIRLAREKTNTVNSMHLIAHCIRNELV